MSAALQQNATLPTHQEKVARLCAADELTDEQIATRARINRTTLWRWSQEPIFAARVVALREQFRDEAMRAAPFADKRVRIVTLDAVARDTLAALKDNGYEEVYYYGPDALEAKRFDKDRVEALRKYLAEIADELGDREKKGGTSTSVVVKVYTDARMENPIEADWHDAPPPRSSADA